MFFRDAIQVILYDAGVQAVLPDAENSLWRASNKRASVTQEIIAAPQNLYPAHGPVELLRLEVSIEAQVITLRVRELVHSTTSEAADHDHVERTRELTYAGRYLVEWWTEAGASI